MEKFMKKDYRLFGRPLWSSVKAEYAQTSFPFFDGQKKDAVKSPERKPDTIVPVNRQGFRFKVSSWLLMDFHAKVLANRGVEIMEHVCGLDFGDFLTWERLNRLDLSVQSAIFAKGEASSNLKSLMDIEEHGYCLTGWLHSHTWNGEKSAFASDTDMKNQRTLEAGGYSVIGGVITLDGFVRFFSDKLKFNVEIMGRGIEHVKENLYKISQT